MANLAIKGHTTRGREVIELLRMLGGVNRYAILDARQNILYTIRNFDNFIIGAYPTDTFVVFTLEEFLEKFPYKIGDKVLINDNVYDVFTIKSMSWDTDRVVYKIEGDGVNESLSWYADEMIPYKEEIMEEVKVESFEILEDHCANEVKIEFDPSKYEMVKKDNGYYVVKKQLEYPKTYKECCDILDVEPNNWSAGYKSHLITAFRNLLICRDAYWKIAGDWNPNWSRKSDIKYGICVDCNHTASCTRLTGNLILVFPTEEIRDTFYENFKDLIEECKEFI